MQTKLGFRSVSWLTSTGNSKLGQPMNRALFKLNGPYPFIELFIFSGGALVPALTTCIKISLIRPSGSEIEVFFMSCRSLSLFCRG